MISLAHRKTLVLNASLEPMTVYPLSQWDVKDTFNGILSGDVVAVENYEEKLRSAHQEWDHPSVVVFTRYVKPRGTKRVTFNRLNILIRDGYRCQYCGIGLTMSEMSFDHVIPESQGGPKNFRNIVAACIPCNTRKANKRTMRPMRETREPTQQEMARLSLIRRENVHPTWAPYLEWQGLLAPDATPVSEEQRIIDQVYWEGELER